MDLDNFRNRLMLLSLQTALHYASKDGYEKISKMLLDAGVVVDALDIEGKTPLHYAVVSNPQQAKLLVDNGKQHHCI